MSLNTPTPNGTDSLETDTFIASETKLLEIEANLTQISGLVTDDPSLLESEDVGELLQRLTDAENMAEGMESKLDSVLENLDHLLALLDDDNCETVAEETNVAKSVKSSTEGTVSQLSKDPEPSS
ncbi:hypothetical protein BDZ97DRAFT_959188 [Flammula alnicola]|nr:hypothetical protein BDZ97DRAFT_959188 [Flammula alnicola]